MSITKSTKKKTSKALRNVQIFKDMGNDKIMESLKKYRKRHLKE